MLRRFDNLNRCIIAHLGRIILRQRHLRQTEASIILHIRWASDLENGQHGVRVVERFVTVTHVYVEEGERVAREPAGLETDGAAADGPFGAVLTHRHATACICVNYMFSCFILQTKLRGDGS
jgi:hypothetical protein